VLALAQYRADEPQDALDRNPGRLCDVLS